MAKPNYDFERRQRELAKKAKKEEKLRRKAGHAEDSEAEPAANNTESPSAIPPADPAN